MNTDQFDAAKFPAAAMRCNSARARARHTALLLDDQGRASAVDERAARRSVNTAASLRILIPVALIAMMIASASWKTPVAVGAVTVPAIDSSVSSGETEYYPGKFVNQARVAEDHVQNF